MSVTGRKHRASRVNSSSPSTNFLAVSFSLSIDSGWICFLASVATFGSGMAASFNPAMYTVPSPHENISGAIPPIRAEYTACDR